MHRIILFILTSIIILFSATGEKITYNDGAGWDGLFYRDVAKNFTEDIVSHQYDTYYIQRIAPFALLNVGYNVVGIQKSNSNLMYGITILNLIAAFIGMIYFFKLAAFYKFSVHTEILGFASIFLTFPVLKLQGYYPFLTDLYAMVFAIMQIYYFVRSKTMYLIVLGIVGAFIWPTLLIFNTLLVMFNGVPIEFVKTKTQDYKHPKMWFLLQIAGSLLFMVGFLMLYARSLFIKHEDFKRMFLGSTTYDNIYNLILSLAAVILYLFFVIFPIRFDILKTTKSIISKINYKQVVIAISVFIAVKFLQNFLSSGNEGFPAFLIFAGLITRPLTAPFVFLVNHFLFFGFSVTLFLFFYKKVLCEIEELGLSYFLVFLLSIVFSLGSESRCFINNYIYLLFPLLLVLNTLSLKPIFIWSFVFLNLVLSRFWYQINVPGIEQAFNAYKDFDKFPAQRFYMNLGPWQSHYMYFVFGAIFVLSILCFHLLRDKIYRSPTKQ